MLVINSRSSMEARKHQPWRPQYIPLLLLTFFGILLSLPWSWTMVNDAVLRSSLLWLAAIVVIVGIWTQSLKKMGATYVVGVVGISGVLLPDWGFFARDFSLWSTPVNAEQRAAYLSSRSGIRRFRIYPIRLVVYTTIYGYALYKWWMFISN